MNALEHAHKNGGWVLLQNIHLTIGALACRLGGGVLGPCPACRLTRDAGAVCAGCVCTCGDGGNADWTSGPLEKRVDKLAEGAHPDFRCVWGVAGATAQAMNHVRGSLVPASPCDSSVAHNAAPPTLPRRAQAVPVRRAAACARARPAHQPAAKQHQAHQRAARGPAAQPAARVWHVQRGDARGLRQAGARARLLHVCV
jgi:hypothetical protein